MTPQSPESIKVFGLHQRAKEKLVYKIKHSCLIIKPVFRQKPVRVFLRTQHGKRRTNNLPNVNPTQKCPTQTIFHWLALGLRWVAMVSRWVAMGSCWVAMGSSWVAMGSCWIREGFYIPTCWYSQSEMLALGV